MVSLRSVVARGCIRVDEILGIRMLQINLVIEDAKISLDELQEQIQEIEDYVQSTDVAGECLSVH